MTARSILPGGRQRATSSSNRVMQCSTCAAFASLCRHIVVAFLLASQVACVVGKGEGGEKGFCSQYIHSHPIMTRISSTTHDVDYSKLHGQVSLYHSHVYCT